MEAHTHTHKGGPHAIQAGRQAMEHHLKKGHFVHARFGIYTRKDVQAKLRVNPPVGSASF